MEVEVESGDGSRRERILIAAINLFAEKGFDAISMREIADEADVTTPLITHHFESKQGLREATDKRILEMLEQEFLKMEGAFDAHSPHPIAELSSYPTQISPEENIRVGHYIRRAMIDLDQGGRAFFRAYHAVFVRITDRLDAAGALKDDVDKLWLPYLAMISNLGTLFLEPYITEQLGVSAYEPQMHERAKAAAGQLFEHGMLKDILPDD